ncbi:BAR domain-containing family protein [Cladochytrium replicatum]|nr:BAR domain-containing family protein [Cladochytrium replicatum]
MSGTPPAGPPVTQQVTAAFSSIMTRLQPVSNTLGSTLSRGVTQAQQYAKETFGGPSDVTELPPEYRELEEKVDRVKVLHDNFLRVAKNYTYPHYDWDPPMTESVSDLWGNVTERATALAATTAKAAGVAGPPQPTPRSAKDEIPRSLSHAFARAAVVSAEGLNPEEPLAAALRKFAAAHERVGDARLKQDADAVAKFYQPFLTTLNQTIGHAMKARIHVRTVRLNYDAARAKLKAARPEKVEVTRSEMEAAEDEFVAAVDDAMGKMKVVVENPEPLKNLADLVAIQLSYFKEAYEALADLAPEIDELQVTNEALLRNPQ